MLYYNPIGKTLSDIQKECEGRALRFAVFVLKDERDHTGEYVCEDFFLGSILEKYPQYANYKVKRENDHYGTTVLRVEKGGVDE